MPNIEDPTVEKPITLTDSTLPTTLAAALRYGISLLCTFALGRGWVDADNVEGIGAAVVAVATVGYGLWKTRQNRAKLIVAADAAPNSVAKVVKT